MTEINHAGGIDCQSTTKITIKGRIIIHFRTMEIGKDIKIVMKTSIGMKIFMIMIDPMILIILKVEKGHMIETGHIVETGTIPKNTKETGHTIKIDYMAEMIHIVETGHIVEVDCKTTVEMSIRRKVINIREGLEIIMKTYMRTGTVRINMNANSEMTNTR